MLSRRGQVLHRLTLHDATVAASNTAMVWALAFVDSTTLVSGSSEGNVQVRGGLLHRQQQQQQ